MNSRLLASTLLAASLLAAPAVAFAQTSPPPDTTGPSGAETQTAPRAMRHHATHRHMAHRTHFGAGTTTGMSSSTKARPGGRPVSQKPPGS